MYTVFVIGNIASGKSAACRHLKKRGGRYIDLDDLVKSLYEPESQLVLDVAEAFGSDVLLEDGTINRKVLAARAFADDESTQKLNNLVHPYALEQLGRLLVPPYCCTVSDNMPPFTVVEVSVPKNAQDAFPLADDIVAITVPFELRRERALGRGMSEDDFEARASKQPSEEELCAMASVVIDNSEAKNDMFDALDELLAQHGLLKAEAAHA